MSNDRPKAKGDNPSDKDGRNEERREILERMVKSEADKGLYALIPDEVRPRLRTRRRR